MINLILTNSLDNSSILQALKHNYNPQKRQMLLVPDRFTLSYEKSVLDVLGLEGSFSVEVSSFSRLANKTLKDKAKLIDLQTEIMMLRKIIDENKQDLLTFKNFGGSIGFAKEIGAVISQIRNSGISVKMLLESAEKLPTKLANKTKDIALIYSHYVDALQNDMRDGTGKLQALASTLADMPLKDCDLYITEFLSLSKLELDIVQQLMISCGNCVICMVDSLGANRHIFPKGLINKIEQIAKDNGLAYNVQRVESVLPSQLNLLADNLFGYNACKTNNADQVVSVVYDHTVQGEIKNLALNILDQIKAGMRYKDIAVLCCNPQAYLPILAEIFDKFEIAYYADITSPLSCQAISQLVFSYLKVVQFNFRQKEVMELARQILLGLDFESVCTFENYCLKKGIEFNRFLKPFEINDNDDSAVAEKIRVAVTDIVGTNLPKVGHGKEFVKIIQDLFDKLDMPTRIQQLADNLILKNDRVAADVTTQSFDKFNQILTKFVEVLGDSVMTIDNFNTVIASCIQSEEISTVPMYADCVFVGDISQSRFENIDSLYVVGASEGFFPMQHNDVGIVGERDIHAWATTGVVVEPCAGQMNYTEKLKLLMLLLKPKKNLTISYSVTGTLGEKLLPSSTVDYICESLNINKKKYKSPSDEWELKDYIRYYSGKQFALENLMDLKSRLDMDLLSKTQDNLQMLDLLYHRACLLKGKQFVDSLLNNNGLESKLSGNIDFIWKQSTASPSRLEKYFNCPFQHFIDYILKAKEREQADLEVQDMGSILHEVAQKFFALPNACEMKTPQIIHEIENIYIQIAQGNAKVKVILYRENGRKILKELYDRSCKMLSVLVEKMQNTSFRPDPNLLEKKFGFGNKDDLPPIQLEYNNRVINVRGIIDRIDRFEDKYLIFDYKSKSTIDFKPTNIIYGDRCQMFIYLNAMASSCLTPAGVFYILMSDKMKKAEQQDELYRYVGFVNANLDNIEIFDKTLKNKEKGDSSLYPIKVKSTKEKGVCIDDKYTLSPSDLANIAVYVKKLCQKAVQEIGQGYVKPSPIVADKKDNKLCQYCDYARMCGIYDNPQNVRVAKNLDIFTLKEIAQESKD